ncbi:MAG TPA: hypothetical protein VLJ84_04875 [Usitatibacter sp.]|nr:hypothetical protein [Usitatibacter sp.]
MKRFAVVLLALAGFACANAAAQEKQFDFLIGQWDVEVRPKVSGIAAAIHGEKYSPLLLVFRLYFCPLS